MTVQRCFWHNTKAALLAASLMSAMPLLAQADCKDPEQQLPPDFTMYVLCCCKAVRRVKRVCWFGHSATPKRLSGY